MSEQIKMVDVDTALDWVRTGQVVVVDVRERHEYEQEHIEGALSLPLSEFEPAQLPPVPAGKKLLLHCRSANRCGIVAGKLVESGYRGDIHRLAGGLLAWVAAGAPVVEAGEPS